jgi:hypothetical protein
MNPSSRCQTPRPLHRSGKTRMPARGRTSTRARLVGLGRFERPTSRLSGVRSDQLSYRPKDRRQRTESRQQTTAWPALTPQLLLSAFCPPLSDLEGMCGRRPGPLPESSPQTTERKILLPSAFCPLLSVLRKEVIQPQVPLRLPCYDFTPVADLTVDGCSPTRRSGWRTGLGSSQLPWCDGRCVQGPGTYSPRHADPRLLAIPPSCRRVAACNPN